MIHGDPQNIYPTHTHGLHKINLPEVFINSSAFGPNDNANAINEIVIYLILNPEEYCKVFKGEYIEIQLFNPKESDLIFCLRRVNPYFSGVKLAYPEIYDEPIKGFRQLYIKGDIHVLKHEYFDDLLNKQNALPKICLCGDKK